MTTEKTQRNLYRTDVRLLSAFAVKHQVKRIPFKKAHHALHKRVCQYNKAPFARWSHGGFFLLRILRQMALQ